MECINLAFEWGLLSLAQTTYALVMYIAMYVLCIISSSTEFCLIKGAFLSGLGQSPGIYILFSSPKVRSIIYYVRM